MWFGSRFSRWIAKGACVCRCAMWTPPRAGVLRGMALAAAIGAAAIAVAGTRGAVAAETPVGGADSLASVDGRYDEWLDPAVPPRVDFFRHANGGWINSNPIPADRSYWGVDTLLEQKNQTFIRDLLVSLARDGAAADGSVQRQLADFYASGMDEPGIEAAGIAPLQAEFDRIAAIADTDELQAEFGRLQMIGVAAPLQFGQMQDFKDSTQVIALVLQSGLGLPNRDYY